MELVNALEQLSIHVKSGQKNLDLSRSDRPIDNLNINCTPNTANQNWDTEINNPIERIGSDDNHQVRDTNDTLADDLHRLQLKEFDDSIETLFTQLVEINDNSNQDCDSKLVQHNRAQNQDDESDGSCQWNHGINGKCNNFSDYSSSSSGSSVIYSRPESISCPSDRQMVGTFVTQMMQKDLSGITETVRKLGFIVKLGGQIDTIHRSVIKQSANGYYDVSYCHALCNLFVDLCSSEPYLLDLPTLRKYNQYCQELLTAIDKATGNRYQKDHSSRDFCQYTPGTAYTTDPFFTLATSSSNQQITFSSFRLPKTFQDSNSNNNSSSVESLNTGAQKSETFDNVTNLKCLGDALDCALLESDEKRLEGSSSFWTDNKLYNNNSSNI